MKKSIYLLLFFVGFSTLIIAQSWQQIADFPGTKRDDGVTFTIGHKAYCLTGYQEGWTCAKDAYVFDADNQSWNAIASLPASNERQYASAFSYNGYGYVFGGVCSGTYLSDFWKYDPVNDSWQSLAALPDSARMGCSSFVLGDKAYMVGGLSAAPHIMKEVWEYDITNDTWLQKNDLPFNGIWRGNGFSVNDTGYVCNGKMLSAKFNHGIYRYEQHLDSWTILPGYTLNSCTYGACAVNDRNVCFYGGVDSTQTYNNDFFVFNPDSSSIHHYAGLSLARKGGMAFSINGLFYYTAGIAGVDRLNETWRNDFLLSVSPAMPNIIQSVYPVPANDNMNVVFQNKDGDNFTFSVIDVDGRKLFEMNNIVGEKISFDVKMMSSGIYFFTLYNQNSRYNYWGKFVVGAY